MHEHPTPAVLASPPRGGPAQSHLIQPARGRDRVDANLEQPDCPAWAAGASN